jgi:hypothetical protein
MYLVRVCFLIDEMEFCWYSSVHCELGVDDSTNDPLHYVSQDRDICTPILFPPVTLLHCSCKDSINL